MKITCGLCGEEIVVADDLADGQHIRCPYCEGKTEYRKPSRIELPTGLNARRGSPDAQSQPKPFQKSRSRGQSLSRRKSESRSFGSFERKPKRSR